MLTLTTGEKGIKERYCKKNDVEEVPEDAVEELKQQEVAFAAIKTAIEDSY